MELYDVVLCAHIAVFLCAIALAGTLHSTEWLMRSARTVGELRVLARPQKWGVGFQPVIALLLLLGSWLVSLSKDESTTFSFSDGWVWTALIALGLLFVGGGAVMGPAADRLNKAVDAAGEGPVSPELRALSAHRLPWVVGHAQTLLAVSVACNMVNKPSAPVALLVLVVGASIGATVGVLGSRRAAREGLPST